VSQARQPNVLSSRQILRAALVVLLGFLASGALGLIRTAAYSATFGASAALDTFYAAQRIPEMLFVLVAGGALGSSFIPVFARFTRAADDAGAWRLASAVLSIAAVAATVLTIVIGIFTPQIVVAAYPALAPELQALMIDLTRIMLLTVIIFSVSGLLMGILNAQQVFTLPALAAAMYNVGQIIGALVLARVLPQMLISGEATANVYGLAWGAVLGAALHLLVQLPGLRSAGARLRFLPNLNVEGAREVLLLMGPRVLGLAVVQINFLVNAALAAPPNMIEGSYTALVMGWTLMFFVLGVIAQSVGTALFPSLSALAAAADMTGFRERLASAMRSVLFLAFPAMISLFLLRVPIISLWLERGEWSAAATQGAAWALLCFAIGIPGHALLEVLSRAFYALSDTWTPVRIGIAAMLANIALSLVLMRVIGSPNSLEGGAFGGLALANAVTTLIEAGVLWLLLRRRIGGIQDATVLRASGGALLAALIMGAVIAVVSTLLPADASALLRLMVSVPLGGVVFFGLAFALRLNEARLIVNIVRQRIGR
jgi:putative peptidoglycan lipid II flippase